MNCGLVHIPPKGELIDQPQAVLAYPKMEAMDFTAQEAAAPVHDLNLPLRPELHGRFDVVIDGGTTEHIFHIGTALDTCHQAEAGRDAAGGVA